MSNSWAVGKGLDLALCCYADWRPWSCQIELQHITIIAVDWTTQADSFTTACSDFFHCIVNSVYYQLRSLRLARRSSWLCNISSIAFPNGRMKFVSRASLSDSFDFYLYSQMFRRLIIDKLCSHGNYFFGLISRIHWLIASHLTDEFLSSRLSLLIHEKLQRTKINKTFFLLPSSLKIVREQRRLSRPFSQFNSSFTLSTTLRQSCTNSYFRTQRSDSSAFERNYGVDWAINNFGLLLSASHEISDDLHEEIQFRLSTKPRCDNFH